MYSYFKTTKCVCIKLIFTLTLCTLCRGNNDLIYSYRDLFTFENVSFCLVLNNATKSLNPET